MSCPICDEACVHVVEGSALVINEKYVQDCRDGKECWNTKLLGHVVVQLEQTVERLQRDISDLQRQVYNRRIDD